jgi:agmatine/peptidylarginine deiminase
MNKNILKYHLFVFISFYSYLNYSQGNILPKGPTDAETEIISQFQFKSFSSSATPPSGAVRTAAEWEEVEYLVIRWTPGFQNILRQIVEVGVNECKVIIATQNQSSVSSYLSGFGIDLTKISFLNVGSNSIWIRDYAGNTIYTDDVGQRALVDWIYNRPRPLDDAMPAQHANFLGLPIYETDSGTDDLVNTGGNFMSDGLGTAFASELVLEENNTGNPYGVTPKTETDIDNIMSDYMGIDNYIKMPTLPYDGIHHIDMHMKLLDEETILVSKYPTGVADGPQIEANIQYVLNNHLSAFGTPYDIEWIDAPPSVSGLYPDNGGFYRTYSNSLFLNKSVIVPTYRPSVDGPALEKYQELLPGYNIVGIDVDNTNENLISLGGAIHCITHTIGVADPLMIVHQPVDVANAGSNIAIDAIIKHDSGINNAKVFWREEGTTTFSELTMNLVNADEWSADIPTSSNSFDIDYYIWAESNSGKQLSRPIVAPQGYWTTDVVSLNIDEWASNNISGPFPNPTKANVSFNLNHIAGPFKISVVNTLGQLLYAGEIEKGHGKIDINLNDAWNGILYIVFEGQFGKVTKKLIKI